MVRPHGHIIAVRWKLPVETTIIVKRPRTVIWMGHHRKNTLSLLLSLLLLHVPARPQPRRRRHGGQACPSSIRVYPMQTDVALS